MSETRTQGADGPQAGGQSPSIEDTSVRPPWRTKLTGKGSTVASRPGGAPAPAPSAPSPAASAASASGSGTTATVATPVAAAPAPARASAKPAARRPRGPRRARLRLTRIDPWSVMKTSFLLSIAFAVVTVVSVTIVWSVLGAAGVWDSVNASVQQVVGGQDTNNFDIEDYVGMSRVLGFTMLISVLDIVLITAVATLSAFLYNLSAALLGGIEVTLAEDSH